LILPALVLAGAQACRDLPLVCTSEGPTWEVSPSSVDVGIGQHAYITVTQVSCSGRRREPVYPQLVVADTAIALAVNTERYVLGRALGATTLTITGDNGARPVTVSVRVR
jgi:hypothetical protein